MIPDPPVPGAMDFIRDATKHFRVAIFSSRSNQPGGVEAMQEWVEKYIIRRTFDLSSRKAFLDLEWPLEKPPAMVTIDDRAITFTGTWPTIESLKAFQPWNKKAPAPNCGGDPSNSGFRNGAQACREMMARFVEQGGDSVTANSIRLNWNPAWGTDPGRLEGA